MVSLGMQAQTGLLYVAPSSNMTGLGFVFLCLLDALSVASNEMRKDVFRLFHNVIVVIIPLSADDIFGFGPVSM